MSSAAGGRDSSCMGFARIEVDDRAQRRVR